MHYSNPETIIVDALVSSWVKLYRQGKPATWIADKDSVHVSTVYRRLRSRGVTIRTVGQVKVGDLNPNWRENPGYAAVHQWVKIRMPKPDRCQDCKTRPAIDLANISSTYNAETYTRDLKNWEWLCRKCHMTKDGRISKLYHGGKPTLHSSCKLCSEKHEALGYCTRHYQQFKRLGKTWL